MSSRIRRGDGGTRIGRTEAAGRVGGLRRAGLPEVESTDVDLVQALRVLRDSEDDPENVLALRELLGSELGGVNAARFGRERLAQILAARLGNGRLLARTEATRPLRIRPLVEQEELDEGAEPTEREHFFAGFEVEAEPEEVEAEIEGDYDEEEIEAVVEGDWEPDEMEADLDGQWDPEEIDAGLDGDSAGAGIDAEIHAEIPATGRP